MMGRGKKVLSYDEEIDNYIKSVIANLQKLGIKRVSKADALRFIIKQNEAANLNYKRKKKTKKEMVFFP